MATLKEAKAKLRGLSKSKNVAEAKASLREKTVSQDTWNLPDELSAVAGYFLFGGKK